MQHPDRSRSTPQEPSAAIATVVIAEDDRRVRESLERALRLEGYDVVAVPDGAAALRAHDESRPEVMVLDVSMPNADGISVCRKLRERGHDTQILMLTARHEVEDRVVGLDAGADDYLVKPFALEELLARLRARLRAAAELRGQGTVSSSGRSMGAGSDLAAGDALSLGECLRLGDLEMDVDGRLVTRAGRRIQMSRTEFDLLELLVRNAGIVLNRFDIYEHVWDGELEASSKTLDVYIGYLRRKTEQGSAPRVIHTVRGVGYVARLDQ